MAHTTSLKVRFYELDPYDHVNHTNYLNYFETARIEALTEIGYGLDQLKKLGVQIVLVEIRAQFHASATLHEVLDITTRLVRVNRASSEWAQIASRDGETIANLEVRSAFTDLEGKPCRAPAGFAEAAARLS